MSRHSSSSQACRRTGRCPRRWSAPWRRRAGRQPARGRPGTSAPAAGPPGCPARADARGQSGASGTRMANSLRYGALCTRSMPMAARAASSRRAAAAPPAATSREADGDPGWPGRSWQRGHRGPGWCRCCWPPCHGGCPAPGHAGSSRRRAAPRCPWCGPPGVPGSGAAAPGCRRAAPGRDRRTGAPCPAAGPPPRRCRRHTRRAAPARPARRAPRRRRRAHRRHVPARRPRAIGSSSPKALGCPRMTPATGRSGLTGRPPARPGRWCRRAAWAAPRARGCRR